MNASKTIPIVHPNAIDPLNTGLVVSLCAPRWKCHRRGAADRRDQRKTPGHTEESGAGAVARGGAVEFPDNPAIVFSWKETQGAARALGAVLQSHEVKGLRDFAPAFAMITEERPDALLVLQDAVTMQQRSEIIDFAIQKRLPSMFQEKGWALAGGLMSYGENLPSMNRRAAYFVDKIFKGAKPDDLPVEQATKFDLVINLTTARKIGLTIPRFDPWPRRRRDEERGPSTKLSAFGGTSLPHRKMSAFDPKRHCAAEDSGRLCAILTRRPVAK